MTAGTVGVLIFDVRGATMSVTPALGSGSHLWVEGRDSMERCQLCRTTRTKAGKVIPATALCPTLFPKDGIDVAAQYMLPVEAFLTELGISTSTPAGIAAT